MPIPPKRRTIASADAARLVDILKQAGEWVEEAYRDIDDFIRYRSSLSYDKLMSHRDKISKHLNESLFYARKIEQDLGEECNMNSDTIRSVHENGTVRIPLENDMTVDTNLGRLVKDGFLIPRVGYSQCLEYLKSVKPKDESNWINESRANKCFGFRGSEANFLKSWMNIQFYHGTNDVVETYGILSYDSRKRAFKYDELKSFADRYYSLFFLWQVGLLRKRRKAFVIEDGEKYLLHKD
ncbi:MAG: hypothetical protein J6Q22_10115 [Prevotella sp.]|nr:hypothetical protein [Prevotella sp.]